MTHINDIWFHRLSPERSCPEDVKRADSLRGFTRQDKKQLQCDWPSTSAEHRMPRREFLQVRSYPSRLDFKSDTSHSFDHDDAADGQHRREKQQIKCYSIIRSFLDHCQICHRPQLQWILSIERRFDIKNCKYRKIILFLLERTLTVVSYVNMSRIFFTFLFIKRAIDSRLCQKIIIIIKLCSKNLLTLFSKQNLIL